MKIVVKFLILLSFGSTAFGAISREHCKTIDNRAACFIEIESEGKSSFYTSTNDYEDLALDDRLASLNIEFEEVSLSEYQTIYATQKPISFVYNEGSVTALDFSDVNCGQRHIAGWWSSWGRCSAGTAGGALLGGLTGASLGPVGVGVGAVGGALAGAAASCGSTVFVRYRGDFVSVSVNC